MRGIFSPDVNFNIQPESPVAAVQPYTESAIASALSLGATALGSVGKSSGTSSSVSPDQIKWYTEKLNVVAGISNSTQQELAWRKLQFEAGGNGIKLGDWSNSLDQSILGKTREQLVKGEEGAYRDFIEGDPIGQNARAAHLRDKPNDHEGAFNAARDAVEQRRAIEAKIQDMGSKDQAQRLELLPDVKARLYNFRDNGMLYLKNLIASGQPIDPALSNIVQGELARMISPLGDLTQYGQAGKDLQKEYEIILGGTTKLLDALGKADPSSRAMARILQSMSKGGMDQLVMDLYSIPTNIVLGTNPQAMIEAREKAIEFAGKTPIDYDSSKSLSNQVSQIFGRSLAGDLSVTGSDYPGVGLGIFNPESLAGVDALPAQARSANSNVIDLMVAATNPTKSPEDVKAFVDLSVTQALNSSYTGNGDFPSLDMLAKSFGPGFQQKLSQLPADEQQKVRVAVSASLDSNRRARVNEAESARNRFPNGIGFDANRNQFTIDAKTLMDNVPDSTSKGAVNLFLQRLSKVYGNNGNDYTLAINKALEGKLRGLEDHIGAMRSLGITSMARYKTHSSAVTGLDKLLFQIGGSGEQYTPSSLVTDFNLSTNRNTPVFPAQDELAVEAQDELAVEDRRLKIRGFSNPDAINSSTVPEASQGLSAFDQKVQSLLKSLPSFSLVGKANAATIESVVTAVPDVTSEEVTSAVDAIQAGTTLAEIQALGDRQRAIMSSILNPVAPAQAAQDKQTKEAPAVDMTEVLSTISLVESNNDVNAKGAAGEIGLFQIIPETAADPGYGIKPLSTGSRVADATEAEQRDFVQGYINKALERYDGNLALALAAYNAGIGRVDQFVQSGRPLPASTVKYVDKYRKAGLSLPELNGGNTPPVPRARPTAEAQGGEAASNFSVGLERDPRTGEPIFPAQDELAVEAATSQRVSEALSRSESRTQGRKQLNEEALSEVKFEDKATSWLDSLISTVAKTLFGSEGEAAELKDSTKQAIQYANRNPIDFIYKSNLVGLDENNPDHQEAISGFINRFVPGRVKNPSEVEKDANAWCAAFVGHVLSNLGGAAPQGAEGFNALRVRQYLRLGKQVSRENAQAGDLVIMRNPITGDYHTGFFVNSTDQGVAILGGNQNNQVNVTRYPNSRDYSIRRIDGMKSISPEALKAVQSDISEFAGMSLTNLFHRFRDYIGA